MESPRWRALSSVFILLSLNDVPVFSQNLPPPSAPFLPVRNRECAKSNAGPSSQLMGPLLTASTSNGVLSDITSSLRIVSPENRALVFQEGIVPPPYVNIPPPPFNCPCSQVSTIPAAPPCTPSSSTSNSIYPFPVVSASVIPPGGTPAPIVPSPALTLSQNLITAAPLPQELPPLNFLPHPPFCGMRQVPLASPQLCQVDNFQPMLPDMFAPFPNCPVSVPNYPPFVTAPGTATFIPYAGPSPMIPYDNCFAPISFPEDDICQSNIQITTISPILPDVQIPTEVFTCIGSNSYPGCVTTDNNQLPINLQINLPPPPAPVISIISSLPSYSSMSPFDGPSPYGMYPPYHIIMGGSRSKWKNLLPIILIALFSNDGGYYGGGGGGCGCCCSCECSDPIPIPYPIPIATNNPIVLGKSRSMSSRGSKRDSCDSCDRRR